MQTIIGIDSHGTICHALFMVSQIESPDSHHLAAAQGWLGLGDWREADRELKHIAAHFRLHPYVLEVQYDIHFQAERWDLAAETASALIKARPHQPEFWILYAAATFRGNAGEVPLAKTILKNALSIFPREPVIWYDLACYESLAGDLEEARKCLENAFETGDAERLKLMTLADRDLAPLWPEIAKRCLCDCTSERKMSVIFVQSW